ncbi:hypothetical protein QCI44_11540 [Bacillus cereus group sp. RP37]
MERMGNSISSKIRTKSDGENEGKHPTLNTPVNNAVFKRYFD